MPLRLPLSLSLSHKPPTPSLLSIPPSPTTPLSPLPRSPRKPRHPNTFTSTLGSSPPRSSFPTSSGKLPPPPLSWQWTCHRCAAAYPLGATRRCLEDGHFFCAGERGKTSGKTNMAGRTKTRRGRACGSAFDYTAWKGWGRWRRGAVRLAGDSVESAMAVSVNGKGKGGAVRSEMTGIKWEKEKDKNCWLSCDYPSHCRWGKTVGVHTPSPSPTQSTFSPSPHSSAPAATAWKTAVSELPALARCSSASPSGRHTEPKNPPIQDAETHDIPSVLHLTPSPSSSVLALPRCSEDATSIDPSVLASPYSTAAHTALVLRV